MDSVEQIINFSSFCGEFKSFLRDPTGDLPFEEDPAGKDVIHILEASVSRIIKVSCLLKLNLHHFYF